MSVRLGIIISKDCNINTLDILRKRYALGLYNQHNAYVDKQLKNNEIFLQATQTGCDDLTGIGAYDIYKIDSSQIREKMTDSVAAQITIDQLEEKKRIYVEDAKKWIEVIKTAKCKYKINKFGLFWHFCTCGFSEEKIDFSDRIICDMDNISIEYLMKIKENTIIIFD